MKKRLISILLTTALAVTSLAGCGGGDKEAPKEEVQGAAGETPTEAAGDAEIVTYYCGIGAYLPALQAEIDKWNAGEGKDKGVYIQLTSDIDEYGTNLTAMMDAGNFPDIFDYAYGYRDFTAKGYVRDLNEVPGMEDTIERFKPFIDESTMVHDGKLVDLPLEVIPVKFAYNVDLFEKNNLEEPKTWQDVYECAKVITENGDGVDYGYGFTYQWAGGFRRLALKAFMNNTGKGFWDPNTGAYDFTPFKDIIELYTKMYQEGLMFPDPAELSIDGIRSKFSEGHVGMIVAYGYDIGVYNQQFPAQCNWKVIDCPAWDASEAPYKGIYLNRGGVGITTAVSEEHLPAVVEAVKFLYSEDLYKTLYACGGIIPHDPAIKEGVTVDANLKNLAEMADLTNYVAEPLRPDKMITLEGDNFETVFQSILIGEGSWDELVPDLNDRYNAAYKAAKDAGDIKAETYEYPYSLDK